MMVVMLAALIVAYGALKHVDVYKAFIEGASNGLRTVAQILPYLAAALLLIGVLRGSGVLQSIEEVVAPCMRALSLPDGLLPFLLVRPLSGSASLGVLQDLIARYGVDSQVAFLAAALMGSSETVLYTVSIYLAAAGVRKSGYCIIIALISMVLGTAAVCLWLNLN